MPLYEKQRINVACEVKKYMRVASKDKIDHLDFEEQEQMAEEIGSQFLNQISQSPEISEVPHFQCR